MEKTVAKNQMGEELCSSLIPPQLYLPPINPDKTVAYLGALEALIPAIAAA